MSEERVQRWAFSVQRSAFTPLCDVGGDEPACHGNVHDGMDDDMHDNAGGCNDGYACIHDDNDRVRDVSEALADDALRGLQRPVADRKQLTSTTEDRLKRILFSFVRICFIVFILLN